MSILPYRLRAEARVPEWVASRLGFDMLQVLALQACHQASWVEHKRDSCTCETCQKMCAKVPCWGTPAEIRKIIDAGFGDKLMLELWEAEGEFNEDTLTSEFPAINFPAPAKVGFEGKSAPYWRGGQCALQTSCGLCPLHEIGCKPLEGRMASCTDEANIIGLPRQIAATWRTPEGEAVTAEWKARFGKPEGRAEIAAHVAELLDSGQRRCLGIMGKTYADVVAMAELIVEKSGSKPVLKLAKGRIEWPDGRHAKLCSASAVDRIVGCRFDAIWGHRVSDTAWDALAYCCRRGGEVALRS